MAEHLVRQRWPLRLRRLGTRYPKAKLAYYIFRFLLFEGLNYAENCAINSVKLLIQHEPHFSEQHIFFRQYLRHLLGIQPIRKVTSFFSSPEIGAGCQAFMTMRAIAFAHACGLTYVHTPFTVIAHADRPMPLWVGAWESQFNLGMGEELASESDNRDIVNIALNINLAPLFGFFDGARSTLEGAIPDFRRKYYSNKSPIKNEVFTICVHIRRGDITADYDLFTSTSIFKKIVSEVTAVLDARGIGYKVQIFTQGDLCNLDVSSVEIFSDVDAIWSMQRMIEADILVMSNSIFSYVAGMISNGIKVGGGFYVPLSGWIVYDSNGDFDRIALEAKLVQHLEAKASQRRLSARFS